MIQNMQKIESIHTDFFSKKTGFSPNPFLLYIEKDMNYMNYMNKKN